MASKKYLKLDVERRLKFLKEDYKKINCINSFLRLGDKCIKYLEKKKKTAPDKLEYGKFVAKSAIRGAIGVPDINNNDIETKDSIDKDISAIKENMKWLENEKKKYDSKNESTNLLDW